jgi:preprotein translocase subunit YajC
VTQILPLLILAALLVAMMLFSRRNKQRAAQADSLRRERITTGTEVMTTSGLYGTVVSVNDDGSVLLSIAPGVEVRWTLAALREVGELPDQYRGPIASGVSQPGAPQAGAPRPGAPQVEASQPGQASAAQRPYPSRPAAAKSRRRRPGSEGSDPA